MKKFITKNVDTALYNFAYDTYEATSTIHWDYEIDKRDWGLKDIVVAVYRIDVAFRIEEDDGFTDGEETIFIKSPWHVTYELKRSGILAPIYCEISWQKKRIELEF